MDCWNRVVPVLILLSFCSAEAHKGWFLDTAPYPLRWSLFLQPLPLGMTLLVLLAVAGLAWLQHRRAGAGFLPDPERFGATPARLAGLYALMPLLLGIHVAVPLAINAMQRHLFVPDVPLPLSLLDLFESVTGRRSLAATYRCRRRSASGRSSWMPNRSTWCRRRERTFRGPTATTSPATCEQASRDSRTRRRLACSWVAAPSPPSWTGWI